MYYIILVIIINNIKCVAEGSNHQTAPIVANRVLVSLHTGINHWIKKCI